MSQRKFPLLFVLVLLCLMTSCTNESSLRNPRGRYEDSIFNFSTLMLTVAFIVAIVVFLLLGRAIFQARQGRVYEITAIRSEQATEVQDKHIIQIVILAGVLTPIIILGGLMELSILLEHNGNLSGNNDPDVLNIQVIGHKWWWEVRYPEEGIISANEIHIPVNQPILFHLTTDDVIHCFCVL